jgi:SAM-dependent methyltransferase
MQLSDMVRLRNELMNINFIATKSAVNAIDGKFTHLLNSPAHLTYKEDLGSVINHIDSMETSITSMEDSVAQLIEKLNQEITDNTQEYLARGYIIDGGYGSDAADVDLERNGRQMELSNDLRSEILVRARGYTDWRFPGLEIGPGNGQWTEHLIAADPLYIVDMHQEFLDSTVSKFTPAYQNRIRPYLTGKNPFDLSMLPANQFGFIFSWNVFDYFPLKETKDMLEQCMNLLRPGGVMMFSFNNCDIPEFAEFAERGARAWMPKTLLIKTCNELGFTIIQDTNTWIEIRKPGELKTVKAHQVLGEIIGQ